MKFPSIKDVAARLREVNRDAWADACDVRLQVYPEGVWAVRSGDSGYDLDHHGYWGSSSVPGLLKRFNSRDVARDLIEQCREHYACEQADRVYVK